ncbi:MAG: RagB/SusD family nutrient uptake outer membrane protein [Bacteroidales bacterium]|nr:RagB/SusD family nutrient uptake outer membrane protein [Bacteroidales bacterium]
MNIVKKCAYALPALMVLGLGSCKSYLDKSPDSDVSAEGAFSNFRNFQGFVEENYIAIPDMTVGNWNVTWNYGEDEILSTNGNSPYVTYNFDLGDFRAYYTNWGGGFTHMFKNSNDHGGNNRFGHAILDDAWYFIRKCNVGLENIDQLKATPDEKNAILGQLYFMRAWWHKEMLDYMGGLPYITKSYEITDALTEPRLSAPETALKCAEDFAKAAEYLPNDWDRNEAGETTQGHNELRLTRATALAYQGKMLLYVASPLSKHGPMTGAGELTYDYDVEYAKKAAEVLGQCITEVEEGKTPYQLATYLYDDIYNHKAKSGSTNNFSEIFWTQGQNWKQPGGLEAMLRGTRHGINSARWGEATCWGPNNNGLCEGSFCIHPTANYVNYAYGMADGTRFEDAVKENPDILKFPFKDRDVRFYHDIIFDGCKYINKATEDYKDLVYCSLYTGGLMRAVTTSSRTGYLCQKFFPHTCNKVDDAFGYGQAGQSVMPWLRLGEVYLMYAEAGAAAEGPQYQAKSCSYTAVGAVNKIRDRSGNAHVLARYMDTKNNFMDEVRRERACELAFEGHRMKDLMRWLLLTERPYTLKTSIEFTRKDPNYDYSANKPEDAELVGFHEETILEREYSVKHYFWPWMDKHIYNYPEFKQNPGW